MVSLKDIIEDLEESSFFTIMNHAEMKKKEGIEEEEKKKN